MPLPLVARGIESPSFVSRETSAISPDAALRRILSVAIERESPLVLQAEPLLSLGGRFGMWLEGLSSGGTQSETFAAPRHDQAKVLKTRRLADIQEFFLEYLQLCWPELNVSFKIIENDGRFSLDLFGLLSGEDGPEISQQVQAHWDVFIFALEQFKAQSGGVGVLSHQLANSMRVLLVTTEGAVLSSH